jgi:NAD(P)-dependent dehydrogenase (short-subunit alcohol dehydrogenase family)
MRVWFITGCSRGGIGEGIARAVLRRGDRAVVTARSMEKIEGIVKDYPETALGVVMDLTVPASVDAALVACHSKFGTIDVLVNNAGYAYRSSVEEAENEDVQQMYATNFFGPVSLIQKVLPEMRKKEHGAIVNISSIGAVHTGAASGFYASSKAALELMSEALAAEVKPLGIKVMVVEPGAFRTHFYDDGLRGSDMKISAYRDTAWKRSKANTVHNQDQPGDPLKCGDVIYDVLEKEDYPFRLLLGSDAIKTVKASLEDRLKEIDDWEGESVKTDFEQKKTGI